MFKVILVNIPHAGDKHFETLEQAKAWMRSACFESTCWDENMDNLFCSFSPISGMQDFKPSSHGNFVGRRLEVSNEKK